MDQNIVVHLILLYSMVITLNHFTHSAYNHMISDNTHRS